MKSSYKESDVTLLLKDITGLITPLPAKDREIRIQNGTHYCEMLPLEHKPSDNYLQAYKISLMAYAKDTSIALCQVAEKIYFRKGRDIVLVSLARAGIPIGILIKHYLEKKYSITVFHYSISIIRGRGVDKNAINHILSLHPAKSIQFVDGWIGKGAIQNELLKSLLDYPELSPELAVISDPANITDLCGTHDDILIPNSCLNSTVSGLISRTFLRNDIISECDYHGAAYYDTLRKEDLSYEFIHEIESHFDFNTSMQLLKRGHSGLLEVEEIANYYHISDYNYIKPSIGEATRVLLRRTPLKLLIQKDSKSNPMLRHLIQLAKEKSVMVEYYPLRNYKACGIIKQFADT